MSQTLEKVSFFHGVLEVPCVHKYVEKQRVAKHSCLTDNSSCSLLHLPLYAMLLQPTKQKCVVVDVQLPGKLEEMT